jgi:RNA polymerase sigma-70 factor (ECF subfamily)
LEELALITALKQSNALAFKQLVETYQHMVFNAALNIIQQAQEAEDVAQEVFIQVYQSIKDFRGDAKLSTWLYRITITKALDHERKKKTKKRINTFKNLIGIGSKEEESIAEFNHPGIVLDNKEQATILFKALKQLPENQKLAFTLIKAEGLTYEEVSTILNTTVKAVEALMHRAKENLRKILKDYYLQN